MTTPTPLSELVADDLMLDRIAARRPVGDDPVAGLLAALAAYADSPIGRPRSRRFGRHRMLTAFAALAVGASGAGVAAAVGLPHAPPQASQSSTDPSDRDRLIDGGVVVSTAGGGQVLVQRPDGSFVVVSPGGAPAITFGPAALPTVLASVAYATDSVRDGVALVIAAHNLERGDGSVLAATGTDKDAKDGKAAEGDADAASSSGDHQDSDEGDVLVTRPTTGTPTHPVTKPKPKPTVPTVPTTPAPTPTTPSLPAPSTLAKAPVAPPIPTSIPTPSPKSEPTTTGAEAGQGQPPAEPQGPAATTSEPVVSTPVVPTPVLPEAPAQPPTTPDEPKAEQTVPAVADAVTAPVSPAPAEPQPGQG